MGMIAVCPVATRACSYMYAIQAVSKVTPRIIREYANENRYRSLDGFDQR